MLVLFVYLLFVLSLRRLSTAINLSGRPERIIVKAPVAAVVSSNLVQQVNFHEGLVATGLRFDWSIGLPAASPPTITC